MKKILFTLLLILLFYGVSSGGELSITTRISYYNPPEGPAGGTIMAGIAVNYSISQYFVLQGSLDHSSYTAEGKQYTLTPITITAIAHPTPYSSFDPYIGAGIGYYGKTVDQAASSTTGLNGVLGISFKLGGALAGLEARYMIPDTTKMDAGFTSLSAYMTGGMYFYF